MQNSGGSGENKRKQGKVFHDVNVAIQLVV
jgi:hypothetical protein